MAMAKADYIDNRLEDSIKSEEGPKPDDANARLDLLTSINNAIARMRCVGSMDEACQAVADESRRLTGFDHVIIYKFRKDGSGAVIAESLGGDFKLCMGFRHPGLNIPITENDRLWGLVMFHHHTGSKYASHDARTACEILAHCLSLKIAAKEAAERAKTCPSSRI
jgi:light-regulated signal transduction histidine kinase (bacteriophytochrome)